MDDTSKASTNPPAMRLNSRKKRVLEALLCSPIYREQADRIAGASNSPELIRQLKKLHGLEIYTKRPAHVDRDGFTTYPGLYVLSNGSIALAQALLRDSEQPIGNES